MFSRRARNTLCSSTVSRLRLLHILLLEADAPLHFGVYSLMISPIGGKREEAQTARGRSICSTANVQTIFGLQPVADKRITIFRAKSQANVPEVSAVVPAKLRRKWMWSTYFLQSESCFDLMITTSKDEHNTCVKNC